MKTMDYRYVKRRGKHETKFNTHIREMIEMIKNEKIKANLYVKGIKLSSHAFKRVKQHFRINNQASATRKIKEILSNATRIGAVLSFDGRINVLYAYENNAIFLSPDLKTVVTVNRYEDISYEPLATYIKDKRLNNKEAIELHLNKLKEIEGMEQKYVESMLEVESKVKEANDLYQTILDVGRGRKRKRDIKDMISEYNLMLKREGRKLFRLNIEKRHVCKSLVALY